MRLRNTILICLIALTSNAQKDRFDSLNYALLFNIYTGTPDSILLSFLKNHFPYLTKPIEPGGWTVYPLGSTPLPKKGIHLLRVDNHPFLKTKHTGARLDVLSQEWPEGPPGIESTRVWVYFSDKSSMKEGFRYIINEFQKSEAYIEHLTKNKQKQIIISSSIEDKEWNSITILLNKKNPANKYNILILFSGDKGNPW